MFQWKIRIPFPSSKQNRHRRTAAFISMFSRQFGGYPPMPFDPSHYPPFWGYGMPQGYLDNPWKLPMAWWFVSDIMDLASTLAMVSVIWCPVFALGALFRRHDVHHSEIMTYSVYTMCSVTDDELHCCYYPGVTISQMLVSRMEDLRDLQHCFVHVSINLGYIIQLHTLHYRHCSGTLLSRCIHIERTERHFP